MIGKTYIFSWLNFCLSTKPLYIYKPLFIGEKILLTKPLPFRIFLFFFAKLLPFNKTFICQGHKDSRK